MSTPKTQQKPQEVKAVHASLRVIAGDKPIRGKWNVTLVQDDENSPSGVRVLLPGKIDPNDDQSVNGFIKKVRKLFPSINSAKAEEMRQCLWQYAAPSRKPERADDSGGNRTRDGAGTEAEHCVVEKPEPLRLAEHYLDAKARDAGGRLLLRRYRAEWWRFINSGYRKVDEEEQSADLWRHLDQVHTLSRDRSGQPTGGTEKLVVACHLVKNVDAALTACHTIVSGEMPQWLDGRLSPDPCDVVTFRNGLLDTAKYCRTGDAALMPPTPEWFSGVACPYKFDGAATCHLWLKTLRQIFSDDGECIDLLQEWMGYNMVADNRYERLMLLHGLPGCGKGTVITGLTALLGADQVVPTTFAKLARRFGLHPLLGKLAAVLPDAHIDRSTDAKAALEVLKAITGSDPQSVDRKGVDELPRVRMTCRFTIGVNEIPELPDDAGALRRRLLLLHFPNSFEGRADETLKAKLLLEAQGIAAWSLEGLGRLRERGQFTIPASCRPFMEKFNQLVSPLQGFLREFCEVGSDLWEAKERVYCTYKEWCEQHSREPATPEQFGKNLLRAAPGVTAGRRGPRGQQFTTYEGVRLLV